jgi:hypothetical protein
VIASANTSSAAASAAAAPVCTSFSFDCATAAAALDPRFSAAAAFLEAAFFLLASDTILANKLLTRLPTKKESKQAINQSPNFPQKTTEARNLHKTKPKKKKQQQQARLTVLKNPHNPTTTFKPPQKPQQKCATITTTTLHNREAARELANCATREEPQLKQRPIKTLKHGREEKNTRARARKHKRGQKRAHTQKRTQNTLRFFGKREFAKIMFFFPKYFW